MVGAVDDDEFFRLGGARVEGAHLSQRAQFVELALNEKLRLRAPLDRTEIVARQRRGNADERRHAWILGADRQRDPGSERHAADPEQRAGILLLHVVERGAEVVRLARAVGKRATACACAAKVDAQHGAADPAERLRGLIHDLRVHRAAVLGVRVCEDHRRAQPVRMPGVDAAVVADAAGGRRLVEERLEPPGRTSDLTRRHDADLP